MRLTIPGRQPRRIPPGPTPNTPDEYQPRPHAVRYLRDKIRVGEAGLDPYDPTILILKASRNEQVWAYRMLELVGTVLTRTDDGFAGQRLRALVEADVRLELGLDDAAPLMRDEALASRGVDAAGIVMDEVLRVLPTVPVRLLEAEPVSYRAIRDAKRAFDAAHGERGDEA